MLRVSVDLIPFGKESDKKEIAKIEIFNTGKRNRVGESEYRYNGYVQDESADGEHESTHKFSGRVEHWRPNSVLILIYKIFHKEIGPYLA